MREDAVRERVGLEEETGVVEVGEEVVPVQPAKREPGAGMAVSLRREPWVKTRPSVGMAGSMEPRAPLGVLREAKRRPGWVTLRARRRGELEPASLEAVTEREKEPVWVGVPERAPVVESKERPRLERDAPPTTFAAKREGELVAWNWRGVMGVPVRVRSCVGPVRTGAAGGAATTREREKGEEEPASLDAMMVRE